MILTLRGSESYYSLEQLAIVLFPMERHSMQENTDAAGDTAVCTVRRSAHSVTAVTEMRRGDRTARGSARERLVLPENDAPYETAARAYNILEKQAIKRSFYTAALHFLEKRPPWGALSGVRPAKLARFAMEEGRTPEQASQLLRSRYFLRTGKAVLCMAAANAAVHAKSMLSPRDISIYVGIPFCPTRCVYCSFISRSAAQSMRLIGPYTDALCREIRETARILEPLGLRVRTVYIGGGTPTTLDAPQLTQLFDTLRTAFDLSGIDEFTVEAGRADTIDVPKLAAIRAAGATRLSINPQTMNDDTLRRIGRAHSAQDVVRAMELSRSMGFDCINMDLIAGLPGEDVSVFSDSLTRVLALAPENVTVHTLAIKKGSALREELIGDEESAAQAGRTLDGMLAYAQRNLQRAQFAPYYLYRQKYAAGSFENIGWTRAGYEGIYNIHMMEELCTILSFGAGGVTKLVSENEEHIERIINRKYPQEYLRDLDAQIEAKRAMLAFYGDRY